MGLSVEPTILLERNDTKVSVIFMLNMEDDRSMASRRGAVRLLSILTSFPIKL
jgi:hypothetical protein